MMHLTLFNDIFTYGLILEDFLPNDKFFLIGVDYLYGLNDGIMALRNYLDIYSF